MKKSILAVTFILVSVCSGLAQARDFDGLWSGTMTKDNGEEYSIALFIEDNNVYSVTRDDEGDLIKNRLIESEISKGYGEQLNYFWINKGGVWTETQMFSISYKSETELSVYHMRHVSNEAEDEDGNTDWGYFGKGILE